MRSAGKVRGLLYAFLACYLTIRPVPGHALLLSAGDTVRIDFDLSAEAIAPPPYQSLRLNLEFGAADLFGGDDQLSFGIFDEAFEGLASTSFSLSPSQPTTFASVEAALTSLGISEKGRDAFTDGTGFYLLGVDLGSFELTRATVQGTDFNGSISSAVNAPITPVPLPAALPLFGSALAMLGVVGWRRRQADA